MSYYPVTDRQRKLISFLRHELAMDDEETFVAFVDDQCPDVTLDDTDREPIGRVAASTVITALQRERNRREL